MFEKYKATKEDIATIVEAIEFVHDPKLEFIFEKKDIIESVSVISWDSEYIFVFEHNKKPVKIAHNLIIEDNEQLGWQACVPNKEIQKILSENNIKGKSFISGSLVTLFIEMQKRQNTKLFTSKESYLATIIHEYGHVYFESHGSSWFSNTRDNIEKMNLALELYKGNTKSTSDNPIRYPTLLIQSEIFAFCTEYVAATAFWLEYKNQLDKENTRMIEKYLNIETNRSELLEESVLDDAHIGSTVFGKILIEKFGNEWPKQLLKL